MKKLFFYRLPYFILIACLLTVVSSCKKGDNGNDPDNNTPEYYVSFKANGSQKKYTSQALVSIGYTPQSKLYSAVLQGYIDYPGSSAKSHLGIIIFNNSTVAANTTYQDPQKAVNGDGDKVPKVLLSYYDEAGGGFISMGPMVQEDGQMPSLPGISDIVADAKVTITKLTSTYIEGAFSGTTYLSTDAHFKTKVVLSEGKFVLRRLQ